MAKLAKMEFDVFGGYRVVGKEIRTKNGLGGVGEFWQACFAEDVFKPLLQMNEYTPEESKDYVGYMRDYNAQEDSFCYVVGMFMKENVPVPDGYVAYDVPELTVAKAWIKGEIPDIFNNAYRLKTEGLHDFGYGVDWSNFYWCEVYTDERFGIPHSQGEKTLTLDYYMPCVKED